MGGLWLQANGRPLAAGNWAAPGCKRLGGLWLQRGFEATNQPVAAAGAPLGQLGATGVGPIATLGPTEAAGSATRGTLGPTGAPAITDAAV